MTRRCTELAIEEKIWDAIVIHDINRVRILQDILDLVRKLPK